MNSISSAYATGAQSALDKFASDLFIKEALSPALLNRAAAAAQQKSMAAAARPDAALAAGKILPRAERSALGETAARKAQQHDVFASGAAARERVPDVVASRAPVPPAPADAAGKRVPLGVVPPRATVEAANRKAMQEVYDKYNPGVPLGQGTIKREGQAVAQRKRDARADMREQQQAAERMSAGTHVEGRGLANAPTAVRPTPRPLQALAVPEHSQVFTNTPYGQGRSVSDVFTNTPYIPTAVPRPMTGANTFNTARMTPARPTSAATQIFG